MKAERSLRHSTCAVLLAMFCGCAAAPPTSSPIPTPLLTDAEVSAFATLLRLEDTRDFELGQLSGLSTSPSVPVRQRAALVLGRIGEAEGIPLLIQLLQDQDTAVAATAAFGLGLMGDSTAVPALLNATLGHALALRPTVVAEVMTALGEIGTEAAAEAVRGTLNQIQPEDARSRAVANAALLAIWKFPRPVDIGHLLEWTSAEDPESRWRATYALVRRATPAATPRLIESVNDPDERVRALAIRGLTAENVDSAGLSRSDVMPIVVAALNDTAYSARINAARALGGYGEGAASHLINSIDSSNPHLRLAAIESLGRIGRSAASAARPLESLSLRTSEPVAIRAAAILALGQISSAEGLRVARRASDSAEWRIRAASAQLLASEAAGDTSIMRLINDQDGRVVAAAISTAITAARDSLRSLEHVLIGLLGHPDVMVRANALRGLSDIGDPSHLPIFLDAYERAIQEEQNDAALAAVSAIASLAEGTSIPERAFFARFDRASDPLIRRRVQDLFGELPPNWAAAEPLETERSEDFYRDVVRQWIVPALATGERPHITISTNRGDLDLELFSIAAPLTVLNLVSLAEAEYFDGQEWPRVVPNFVIQGGDPRGDTSGGPGYAIRDELNRHPYVSGTLGMALAGPDTGGSQFFITHSAQPHLDGGYTVFGQLLNGETATRLLLPGDEILSIRLTSVPDCGRCLKEVP